MSRNNKKNTTMKPPVKKLDISAVTLSKGLFASRMRGEVVEIKGTSFHIQELSSDIVSTCMADAVVDGSPQEALLRFYFCQFGIVKIKGGKDRDTGKAIDVTMDDTRVLGEVYPTVPIRVLKMLDVVILQQLYNKIALLTFLDEHEEDKLDFSEPSEAQA